MWKAKYPRKMVSRLPVMEQCFPIMGFDSKWAHPSKAKTPSEAP